MFALLSLLFYTVSPKNKDTVLQTFSRPNLKGEVVQNGKIDKNSAGSNVLVTKSNLNQKGK